MAAEEPPALSPSKSTYSDDGGLREGGSKSRLTFSSAPVVPRAKAPQRTDYTHSTNKLREIGRENSILVDKIAKISGRPTDGVKQPDSYVKPHLKVASVSSAAVNRKKSYDKIAEENLKMYNRLQTIKPSKELNRQTLSASHKQNEEYKKNCSLYNRETKKADAQRAQEDGWQG